MFYGLGESLMLKIFLGKEDELLMFGQYLRMAYLDLFDVLSSRKG